MAGLSAFLAAIAIAVAVSGLFGVMSDSVTRRTREIGIRMALGAPRKVVLRQVIGQGLTVALMGVALGVPAALLAVRFVQALLFGVSSNDLFSVASATALFVAVGALAGLSPALRASRVDPVVALRTEQRPGAAPRDQVNSYQ